MAERTNFENQENRPEIFKRVSFKVIRDKANSFVKYRSGELGRKEIVLSDGQFLPNLNSTYTVKVIEDTNPKDLLKGSYIVELIDEDGDIQHKEAHLDKASRFRENPTFRTVARLVNGDPDLSTEYRMVTERAPEIKANQQGDEKHRSYTPLLTALMQSERGHELLNLTIDRTVERDSDFIKKEIRNGNNYTREVVVGSGVHAAIWNATRQMYVPDNPALTTERDSIVGGQFARYGRPIFRKNDRMRPEMRDTPHLPGTRQSLTTFTDLAAFQQADMGHESYPTQNVTADSVRINMFLSGRTMTEVELRRANLNPNPDKPGKFLLEYIDPTTGKIIYEVASDRVIFSSGVGEEKTNLDESDKKTNEILREEKDKYDLGKDAQVQSFTQYGQSMGDPAEPFPLKNYKRLVISGKGDGAVVIAGIALGYETQLGKTSAQLDRVEEIIWLGSDFMTKEEFIEKCRARYHWLGLEFPREKFENYYHRIKPIPNARATKLERDEEGNIGVVCKFENKDGGVVRNTQGKLKPETFKGDHYIYAHGFVDKTDEIVGPTGNSQIFDREEIESFYLDDILIRERSQIYYETGSIKKLEILDYKYDAEEQKPYLIRYRTISRNGEIKTTEKRCTGEEILAQSALPENLRNKKNIKCIEIGRSTTSKVVFDDKQKPIGRQYFGAFGRSLSIYKAGPAARLPLTEEEKTAVPVLSEIPENTASIFRYADLTAALSKRCARDDVQSSNTSAVGIFSKENEQSFKTLPEFKKGETRIDKFQASVPKTVRTERLPYDINSLDALRLSIGDQLYRYEFPSSLHEMTLTVSRDESSDSESDFSYTISSSPPISLKYADLFSSLLKDELLGKIVNRLTEKSANRKQNIQIKIPFHQNKVDPANIIYRVQR